MPKVTIWIREKDFAKWQKISNVPAWLHEKINQQ